jgi:transcriptional regulator with XRE-family HTH domain
MKIGSALKAYREKNQLSQESVANYLGIKRELLSYYENDTREPAVELLEKLADLYGADLADFFETDLHQLNTNVALAFRAETIAEQDLKELAQFRKVIKNYLKMLAIEQHHGK